jgi:hypothetical protein
MGLFFAISAVALSLAARQNVADPRAFCDSAEWRTTFAEAGLACTPARFGLVIAPAADAPTLAGVIDEAGDRFATHFDTPQARVAVVAGGSVSPEQMAFLKAKGFKPFPWLTNEQRRSLTASAVRAQIKAQKPGLDDRTLDGMAAAAMAQMPPPDPNNPRERGALAHELGHLWFHAGFKATGKAPASDVVYGSAAPDWIDEMAAVLGENDPLTAQRRSALPALVAGTGSEGLYPLEDYLKMEHPNLAAVAAGMAKPDTGSPHISGARVTLLTGADAQKLVGVQNTSRFYVQSRAFADFMIERTGDPKVFQSVASTLMSGSSFAAWLEREGPRHRLPKALPEFEAAWQDWLIARKA